MQSLLITATSALIIYEAYGKLTGSAHIVKESFIGIIVMAMTLVLDIKIANYLHGKSKETGSPALEADAYHFTTDIMSTIAVIIALSRLHSVSYSGCIERNFVALVMLSISMSLARMPSS